MKDGWTDSWTLDGREGRDGDAGRADMREKVVDKVGRPKQTQHSQRR